MMTNTCTNARTAWAALSPEDQYKALRKIASTVPKRCDRHGWDYAGWMGQRETWEDSLELVAGGAYLDLDEALTKAGDKSLTFALVCAAMSAARKLDSLYRPHSKARTGSTVPVTVEELEGMISTTAESPEEVTAAQDTAARMCRDDLDREIVAHALRGETQEQIAQAVGKDQGTVSRRLQKMRTRFDG